MHVPTIASLRKDIAQLDRDLLVLIQKRLLIAKELGKLKHAEGLPLQDTTMEKRVLARNKNLAKKLGISPQLVAEMTQILMKYSLEIQNKDIS